MKTYPRSLRTAAYLVFTVLIPLVLQSCSSNDSSEVSLSCQADNDLYLTLVENQVACRRYDTPEEAISNAWEGSGVLILADGYPDKTTVLDSGLLDVARKKKLRLYIEYPSWLPEVKTGKPRGTHWERAVVSSGVFGPDLEELRILAIHDCYYVPVDLKNPDIVIARVAGFDHAVYGLPDVTIPILARLRESPDHGGLMVSATKLSQFITGRYGPYDAWQEIWKYVFNWLVPGRKAPDLKWTPDVRPSFGTHENLPPDAERAALQRGIDWYFNSRMMVSESMLAKYNQPTNGPEPASANPDRTQEWPFGHRIALRPGADTPVGDGSHGVMEGFDAKIFTDGTQPVRWWRRNDCNGEVAGAFTLAALALDNSEYLTVGGNIADWLYFRSPMSLGERADPDHPAYGLVGWNDVPEYTGPKSMNGYEVYYDDDNARTALGTILSAAILKTGRFDERLSKNLMALMRITNQKGFLPDRIDQPVLIDKGWQSYFKDTGTNLSPGMQSYVWAYFLWAYDQTGFDLFLDRARCAISETMTTFPDHDVWNKSNRARMLLPLSWLVRIEDTPGHRKWLRDMAESLKQESNGAIRDELRKEKWAAPPKSNEEYGTAEAVLLQTADDMAGDLLYTMNFAFVGLHEASAATGESYYKEAEDKLAEFLCRVQIRSEKHPELDGGWFRAFDIRNWEYWASSTDAGWGAWCIESGWSQSWITTVLALRQINASYWDITRDSKIEEHFEDIRKEMLPDDFLNHK